MRERPAIIKMEGLPVRKWEAVATLDTAIADCKNHIDWDEDDWESLADLLKEVRRYILRKP